MRFSTIALITGKDTADRDAMRLLIRVGRKTEKNRILIAKKNHFNRQTMRKLMKKKKKQKKSFLYLKVQPKGLKIEEKNVHFHHFNYIFYTYILLSFI